MAKYIKQEEDSLIAEYGDMVAFYGEQSEITTICERGRAGGDVMLTREEAIAAARAILAHFGAGAGPVGKEEW